MADRDEGNPNSSVLDRELGRVGIDPSPSDIPAQSTCLSVPVGSWAMAATYTVGAPVRPTIKHDDGFLAFGRRAPTTTDRLKLLKWTAKLEAGEALRPGLTDALAAYRHFLNGKGKDRTFSYERFVVNDESGAVILKNAIADLQAGVVKLWLANQALVSFQVTGTAIPCGGPSSVRFPYPATENWQKTIGAHYIWLSAEVAVIAGSPRGPLGHTAPRFSAFVTLHAEDRYNFNPGAADIATGIPDSDNGIFEVTGLAHQYDQFATLWKGIWWEDLQLLSCTATSGSTERHRQPTSNRRLRNRI